MSNGSEVHDKDSESVGYFQLTRSIRFEGEIKQEDEGYGSVDMVLIVCKHEDLTS